MLRVKCCSIPNCRKESTQPTKNALGENTQKTHTSENKFAMCVVKSSGKMMIYKLLIL